MEKYDAHKFNCQTLPFSKKIGNDAEYKAALQDVRRLLQESVWALSPETLQTTTVEKKNIQTFMEGVMSSWWALMFKRRFDV